MSTNGTPGMQEQENRPASDYWLDHCEGFQVFGPDGRVGFVEQVRFSGQRADGFVLRTGLFRTKTLFVQLHEIGSVLPRRGRLDLVVAPFVPRERVSHLLRELCAIGGRATARNVGRSRELWPASDLGPLAASAGAGVLERES